MALKFLPMEKLQPSTNGGRGAVPVAGIQPETSPPELLGSSGNGGDKENAIAFLEAAGFAAEEANVFFVEIDVQELANLALIVAHVARKIGEPRGEFVQSLGDRGGATVYFWRAAGKATERCRDFDDHRHFQFSLDEILPTLSHSQPWCQVARRGKPRTRRGVGRSLQWPEIPRRWRRWSSARCQRSEE